MNKKHILIALLFFSVLFITGWKGCGDGKDYWNYKGLKIPKKFDKHFTTAGQVNVQADVDVSTQALAVIQRGIQTQLEAVAVSHPGYGGCAGYLQFYTVSFLVPTAQNSQGAPSLLFGGQNIAGTVTGTGWDNFPYQSIILPHQSPSWQWLQYLENASRYESEHLRAWNCDKEFYFQSSQPGHIHPIYPKAGESPGGAWSCTVSNQAVQ